MITLAPNERRELARATGRRLRVEHQLVSGDARVIASGLEMDRDVAWERQRWRQRRAQVYDWIRDRVRDALTEERITPRQALALRDQIRDGDLSSLPDRVRDRVTEYLGREPPEVQADTTATRTIVRAPRGVRRRDETVVLVVEAVAGPAGAVVDVGSVEAR
jgi:hypothetical protein